MSENGDGLATVTAALTLIHDKLFVDSEELITALGDSATAKYYFPDYDGLSKIQRLVRKGIFDKNDLTKTIKGGIDGEPYLPYLTEYGNTLDIIEAPDGMNAVEPADFTFRIPGANVFYFSFNYYYPQYIDRYGRGSLHPSFSVDGETEKIVGDDGVFKFQVSLSTNVLMKNENHRSGVVV